MTYDDDNVFAKILRGELPCHKVYETDRVLAFMDVMPRGDGHVLVIPKAKARNLLDVEPDDLAELAKAVQIVGKAAKTALSADGLTIQQFNESAGGQVVFHIHFHVIPRFEGVALKPQTGQMEKPDVLAATADKIRAMLPDA
jgi:histidine triad (HIT) family protein